MQVLTKNIVWSNYLSAPLECPSFTLVRKPLAMPVVPTVALPPWQGGSHRRGRPVAREPVLRVPRGAGAEASREGAVRRDRR